MIRCLPLLLLLFCATGCIKNYETTTMYKRVFTNNSTHTITVYTFDKIVIPGDRQLYATLTPGQSQTWEWISGQKVDEYVIYTDTISADSMEVIFDGIHRMMHYNNNSLSDAPRYYPYNSPRNLMNNRNYTREEIDEKRQFSHVTYTYSFDDKDYNDASK